MDELIRQLNDRGIRYLVFGGQAVRLEGMPRYSLDWDLFIPGHDEKNLQDISELLGDELDVPLTPLGPQGQNLIQTYQTRWGIVQFHLAVAGIDSFDQADTRATIHRNENGIPVRCVCLDDLIASKQAAARPQDQVDIEFLKLKRPHQTPPQ